MNSDIAIWTAAFVLLTLTVNAPSVSAVMHWLRLDRIPLEKQVGGWVAGGGWGWGPVNAHCRLPRPAAGSAAPLASGAHTTNRVPVAPPPPPT